MVLSNIVNWNVASCFVLRLSVIYKSKAFILDFVPSLVEKTETCVCVCVSYQYRLLSLSLNEYKVYEQISPKAAAIM